MANKPNNPSLWSQAKSLARQKFDVYPSAYANGWAAKWYKGKGGTWSKAEYGMEVMEDGGTNNAGFRALPPEVQQNIMDNMAEGGERMPPEIARARFAAAGNMDQMADYGYAYGGYIPEMMYGGMDYMANGGYTVSRSDDRKGKTHKVTGPDGTVKYFGDSNLGQHPKDPERKAAFYARHKKNLDGNPYFRAFARETWADGGQIDMMEGGGSTFSGNAFYGNGGFIPTYNVGDMYAFGGSYDNMYQVGGEETPGAEWHSEWNQDPYAGSAPVMDPETQYVDSMYAQEQAQPMPAMNIPASAATSTKSSPARKNVYNPSIVDYLNNNGIPSDYNTRKQIAKDMGISNYRGTADQNLQMLQAYMQAQTPGQAGPVNPNSPDGAGGGSQEPVLDPATGRWTTADAMTAASVAGLGALGYYGYKKMSGSAQPGPSAKAVKSALSGMGKDDMIKAIKERGYRLSTDYDDLVKAGWKPNEIMKELKGISFKDNYYKNMTANRGKAEAAFTQRLASQNLQTFGDDLKVAKKAYNNRFKTAEPILNEIKQRGTRTANDLARLREAGLSQQEAMGALKGFKFAQAAPEARSFGQAVREGYASLRELPALGKAAKAAKALGKYLPFEEGGEYYMQQGGWKVGDYNVPDWLKTGVQVLDPTGISSYGDVYDAWRDPNTSAFEAGFETLAALPVVGKLGKAAKATSKLGKIMNKVDNASRYVSPVAYMDRKFAPNAAFATMMGNRAAGKNPVTGAVMNMGSLSNQGRRFFTGAEAGVDAMDNMMQYSPKKANGGMVGQEMDVTPEELEMLRAQGYQFEII